MKTLRLALAGNPNAGKSTIFNALTGSHQHVGNWPGKTVEQKSGHFQYQDYTIEIVDLPGTYSLAAFSPEEMIARDYLINEQPDAVITVLDASNLERNLYLAVQVLELGIPTIIVLNMTDVAEAKGLQIDDQRLSQALHSPIIRTVAREGKGIDTLIQGVIAAAEDGAGYAFA
jgi:ferrous iron transport protein B